jgi:hypothetical protein
MMHHIHKFFAALDVPSMLLLELFIHVTALLAAADMALRFVVHALEFKSQNRNAKRRQRALIVLLDNRVYTMGWRNGVNDNL